MLRPPLEKMLFPVQRPGESMRADWDLFFSFSKKKKNQYYFYYFLTKKKKKKDFAAARLAMISATHCTGNKLVLRVACYAKIQCQVEKV